MNAASFRGCMRRRSARPRSPAHFVATGRRSAGSCGGISGMIVTFRLPKDTGTSLHMECAVDRRRKYRKLLRDPSLCAAVIDRLKDGWSPEQISGRLRLAGGVATRLSHETIYQYVYSREGQDQQLGRHLPERRRRRRPRYARKPRSLVFPMECAIRNRPDIINSRSEFGHSARAVTPCCFATTTGARNRS
jgi:hypothetical protein